MVFSVFGFEYTFLRVQFLSYKFIMVFAKFSNAIFISSNLKSMFLSHVLNILIVKAI